ncbi:pentapeptide repeat-containing protein [Sessilibacter corallicola]|uniref:pentapeptide repeat-containing protein n=1 Tax=Sessilibacter corallicola TaxID=2904075 RepID=UPI001E5A8027|nr:pentapeptide repeat-containing protein [Sessilibacter corallicola]MCE2029004.1 pentapeptide repeat-containing protein [Sessilibacter corallicola]
MPTPPASITGEKPVNALFRDLKISPKDSFKALGKALLSGVKQDYLGVAGNLMDALFGISFKGNTEHAAWLLVFRALVLSINNLSVEYKDDFDKDIDDKQQDDFSKTLSDKLEKLKFYLPYNFFSNPEDLSLFNDLQPAFTNWLTNLGMSQDKANEFFRRLKSSFSFSLGRTWAANSKDYECIQTALSGPFAEAEALALGWMQYKGWLTAETQQSIFDEPITLEHIYVPLRAFYYLDKPKSSIDEDENPQETTKTPTAQVVDLESELTDWVKEFNRNNAIKVISGGPGSGKSSATKMFAVTVARSMPDIPVLFIQINKLKGYDYNAVIDFTSKLNYFPRGFNPLDTRVSKGRLLLILDGLDELSRRGDTAAAAATAFVDDVINNVENANDHSCRWQVLITGRDIAVQSTSRNFKRLAQTLYLLPFIVNKYHDKFNDEKIQFEDPNNLLRVDQRDLWWSKYGTGIGQQYEGIPNNFKTDSLLEITREPLLNLLVALTYKPNDFNLENITINKIYDKLFHKVFERDWYSEGTHHGARHLEEDQYRHVLEEIALVAWHSGDARTAKESQIEKRCKTEGITNYLKIYVESAKKDISQLLTAFYFSRSHENILGEDTFEFTHKTFGEYLIAKRLVRELKLLNKLKVDGKNEKELLKRWAEITGPVAIDIFILEFINGRFTQDSVEENKNLQDTISHLLSAASQHDLPMELFENLSFKDMLKQSGNALKMLFVVHHACSLSTKTISSTNFREETNFIKQVINRKNDVTSERLILSSMAYLSLCNQDLSYQNLNNSNFQGADLDKANLQGANLYRANLEGANLEEADLQGAILYRANLEGANLEEANLKGVNLQGANLQGANLQGANLQGANLEKANLEGANLEGANLEKANLEGANLEEANLEKANLEKANLEGANLEEANLEKANLEKANLEKANLEGANLEKAKLEGANLEGASLYRANNLRRANKLDGANLTGAHLEGAYLKGAYLDGASLKGAYLNRAYLYGANLEGANLEGANLERANLEGANLKRANLKGSNLKEANLKESNLKGANLSEANLYGANLNRTNLNRANLNRANLNIANLGEANLIRANLKGTTLKGADLEGADLQGADLQGADLFNIKYNKETIFPDRFDIENHMKQYDSNK